MIRCPKCGAPSDGRYCAQCGTPLPIQCAACGAPVASGHRFCGACGAPVQPQDQSATGKASPAVNVGDIGVMRGTIDASTKVHTTIGSQTNISGPVHVQVSHDPREPTAEEWFARGMQSLQGRQYPQAIDAFVQATQRDPHNTDAFFYLALATLQGHRPKLVSLATVKTVERYLRAATLVGVTCNHALLLWALVKEDAYVLNGMFDRPPTVSELMGRLSSVGLGHVTTIVEHMEAPGNRVWERCRASI